MDLGSCEGFRAEQLHFVWSVVVRVLPSSLVTSLIALRHFQINDVIDDSDEFVPVHVSAYERVHESAVQCFCVRSSSCVSFVARVCVRFHVCVGVCVVYMYTS